MKHLLFAVAIAALNASCPSPTPAPTPPEVTSPDAGPVLEGGGGTIPADIYDAACLGLRKSGCAEGFHEECSHILWYVTQRGLFDVHAACLARCSTSQCVRGCGPLVECTPPGTDL